FMFKIMMPYNSEEEEVKIVQATTSARKVDLRPVITGEELFAAQTTIRDVEVSKAISNYIVDLVAASREGEATAADFAREYIAWGAGLRASQNIVLASKSKAALRGVTTVNLDDVRSVIVP